MTNDDIEKGKALIVKISRREQLLKALESPKAYLGYVGEGSKAGIEYFSTFNWPDDTLVEMSIQKACLAMIRQHIADGLEALKKEFAEL